MGSDSEFPTFGKLKTWLNHEFHRNPTQPSHKKPSRKDEKK